MFNRLIDDMKAAPERLHTQGDAALRRARGLARRVQGKSHVRLWTFQAEALERMDALLQRADELPLVSRLLPPANKLVRSGLDQLTAVPEGYDTLTAKKVAALCRDLDRSGLLAVRRYEQAHKQRKTVLDAVARGLSKLVQPPLAQAA